MRVFLTFLGNLLQRNCYTFCGQIDEVYLYVFQQRLEIFLEQKKLKLVALNILKHTLRPFRLSEIKKT